MLPGPGRETGGPARGRGDLTRTDPGGSKGAAQPSRAAPSGRCQQEVPYTWNSYSEYPYDVPRLVPYILT